MATAGIGAGLLGGARNKLISALQSAMAAAPVDSHGALAKGLMAARTADPGPKKATSADVLNNALKKNRLPNNAQAPAKDQAEFTPPSRTRLDETADTRDILANMVGKGLKGFNDDTSKSDYTRLQQLVGVPMAQKMMNHIFVFNQRPDVLQKNPEQRLQQFYNMGSAHNDLNDLLTTIKGFSQGPVVGMNTTGYYGNQDLTKRVNVINKKIYEKNTEALKP